MVWKTHLIMYFGTNNMKISEVAKRIESLGFETQFGSADFAYNWGENQPDKDTVLELGDKVAEIIQGTGAVFALDTHD